MWRQFPASTESLSVARFQKEVPDPEGIAACSSLRGIATFALWLESGEEGGWSCAQIVRLRMICYVSW